MSRAEYRLGRAREFQDRKRALMPAVIASFGRLEAFDLVVVEGAGSASEINLRAKDIANMGFAEATDVPVMVVGDIDRGGVIASVVGTKQCWLRRTGRESKGLSSTRCAAMRAFRGRHDRHR